LALNGLYTFPWELLIKWVRVSQLLSVF
jgi:hypothetical protein